MTVPFSYDPASFKGMEHAGWEQRAASYDQLFGSVTRHSIEPLLDATGRKIARGRAYAKRSGALPEIPMPAVLASGSKTNDRLSLI
jgi:hypothetical protein